jgi:phospholipase/carboxylesterase
MRPEPILCAAVVAEKTMLERIEIEPRPQARSAVIWLHGLGADGHDFEPLLRQWGLADELAVRIVLPHAPVQPVTLNGGMRMRAWYDIFDLRFNGAEDTAGIERARRLLLDLVQCERERGIDSRNIILAGFSQGGALVLHTALRYPEPLAGVLALSAYLPEPGRLAAEKRADPSRLPLRMDHGLRDQIVPYAAAQKSIEYMQAEGYRVDFHSYAMEHGLCPEQIDSLHDWLRQRLG